MSITIERAKQEAAQRGEVPLIWHWSSGFKRPPCGAGVFSALTDRLFDVTCEECKQAVLDGRV